MGSQVSCVVTASRTLARNGDVFATPRRWYVRGGGRVGLVLQVVDMLRRCFLVLGISLSSRLMGMLAIATTVTLLTCPVAWGQKFTRITEETMRNPSPSDWVAWRGTYQSQGYSPLDQVNRDNVGGLQLAWGWAIESGN